MVSAQDERQARQERHILSTRTAPPLHFKGGKGMFCAWATIDAISWSSITRITAIIVTIIIAIAITTTATTSPSSFEPSIDIYTSSRSRSLIFPYVSCILQQERRVEVSENGTYSNTYRCRQGAGVKKTTKEKEGRVMYLLLHVPCMCL